MNSNTVDDQSLLFRRSIALCASAGLVCIRVSRTASRTISLRAVLHTCIAAHQPGSFTGYRLLHEQQPVADESKTLQPSPIVAAVMHPVERPMNILMSKADVWSLGVEIIMHPTLRAHHPAAEHGSRQGRGGAAGTLSSCTEAYFCSTCAQFHATVTIAKSLTSTYCTLI